MGKKLYKSLVKESKLDKFSGFFKSRQRLIQNLIKHIRWSVLPKYLRAVSR